MDIKVCLAIVTNRGVQPDTARCLMQLVAKTKHDVVPVVATQGYTIAENRSYCVFQALKHQCTHILFIDDDMTFPDTTLEQLLAHKVDIVGVDSKSRTFPLKTTVSLLKNGDIWPPNEVPDHYQMPQELFEVFGIGFGVALINMQVFNLPKPWFGFKADENGMVYQGEDAWFCEKARANGYKVYCDPTLPIGHIGSWEFSDLNEPEIKRDKILIDPNLTVKA